MQKKVRKIVRETNQVQESALVHKDKNSWNGSIENGSKDEKGYLMLRIDK